MTADKHEGVQLPHLETFSKAAETCNFTSAANAVGLTQAAVSQHVHALERALGKPLFQRRGGKVLLTKAGQRLYDYAQQILDLHRKARMVVAGQETPVTGDLFIAASSIPGEHLLPTLLSDLGRKYPHITLHASVSDSMAVLSQVERGEASIGLVGRKTDNPHLDFQYLASDRMVLVAPRGHPLARRKRMSVRQLVGHAIILREAGSGLRHCFEKSLEKAGGSLSELRVALELGSNEAIKKAVLRGVGVAVLSTYVVQKELRSKSLVALKVADLRCDRDMFIVQDKRRVLPPPARLFLSFLETHPVSGQP